MNAPITDSPIRFRADHLDLLRRLIATPSFSKTEDRTADILAEFLNARGVSVQRLGNNVWATNRHFSPQKPTLLLNSHHDTVRPNKGYTRDPHHAAVEAGKLYGLGSNDAGGALICLLQTFLHFYEQSLPWNLVFAASAEEEIGGPNGMARLFDELPPITCAIVGEPTQMRLATAERGLLVVDGYVRGTGGHAAHPNSDSALMNALPVLERLHDFPFPEVSPKLGAIKVTVTGVETNLQHNVVPSECHFVLDVRTTDALSNEATLERLQQTVPEVELKARSFRNQASALPDGHFLEDVATQLGLETYASPTLSDQVFVPVPSVKIGPGKSARSHRADEFIELAELDAGVVGYAALIAAILQQPVASPPST